MSQILEYKDTKPDIHPSAFIAGGVYIIGDVKVGANSNIWFNSTVRGDVNNIIIGENTNIQDNSVIHVATFGQGCYVGNSVTVGHSALLHACTIGDKAFIGMKSCIMDDVRIEDGAMVAAGSLVTPGKIIPSGQLWAGSPARYMRDLTEEDSKTIAWSASHYIQLSKAYK